MRPRLEIGEEFYEIRWTESGRSRARSTGTTDYAEAAKLLADFLRKNSEERRARGSAKAFTVNDALDLYQTDHVEKKVIGKETQGFAIAKFRKALGGRKVADLRPKDIDDYIAARQRGDYGRGKAADGTIIRELSVLRAAFHKAARAKKISLDDIPAFELPQAPEPKDRWLTRAEADKLLTAAKGEYTGPNDWMPRAYRFVVLALATWGRKTAIETMRVDQIDVQRKIIRLNPMGRNQTRKRRPQVPIPEWALPIVTRMVGMARDGYILDRPTTIDDAFAAAVKRAGLKGVTPHTLRHTAATWAAQAGVSLYEIAGLLGDRIETVSRNYLHHCPDHLRGAANAVQLLEPA